jgi:hypothetical protein
MASTMFDVLVIGSGPARLYDGERRRAAWLQDCDRRAFLSRRRLLELGLHSDQGAAALNGDRPRQQHAKNHGLSADNVKFDPAAIISSACPASLGR